MLRKARQPAGKITLWEEWSHSLTLSEVQHARSLVGQTKSFLLIRGSKLHD